MTDMSQLRTRTTEWLVDAHVHFHACFDRTSFLGHAAANFGEARRRTGRATGSLGILMLTESAGARFFRQLRDRVGDGSTESWSVHRTAEAESLEIRRSGEPCLLAVAGRQLATAESLEVLALGCDAEFAEGQPIVKTLDAVRLRGGLPVVPWGFGKWWFGRRKVVLDLLLGQDPAEFCVGDNGGRLRLARRPALFRAAEERGFRVLPGSDPLPFPRHAARAASYGFALEAELDPARPAASVKAALRDPQTRLRPYGSAESLLPFVRNQVAMQLRKGRGVPA